MQSISKMTSLASRQFVRSLFGNSHVPKPSDQIAASTRAMSARAHKRFYKEVSVVHNGSSGEFELCLDNKKLRTPLGKDFRLNNETLARAVAQEWNAQKEFILLSQMHLTGLCNVCIDNPTNATKEILAENTINFLETDTVLFFSDNNERLLARQQKEWQPIIDWYSSFHGNVDIHPSHDMSPHEVSPKTREAVMRHMMSLNFHALNGFTFAVDAAKSIILTTAAVERKISVEEAVRLARLETDVQTDQWGKVEWSHDLELHDTTARLAAATMFVQLSSIQHLTKEKSFQAR